MQTTSLLVRKRILTLFLLLSFGFIFLGTRLFWVQFIKGQELSKMAEQNRMRDVPVAAKRGIIYDRNGKELAISVSADSVYACPIEVRNSGRAREIAHKLAQILDLNEESLLRRIQRPSSFEWVKRQIEPAKARQIRNLELPGIRLAEESHRQYPNGSLASHVLGISGVDNTGLEGVDFYYNDLVGGKNGRIVVEKDAANRPIPEATHKYIPPVEGANLILTIDQTIQYIAERELNKVFKERKARSAAVIIMDPKNGEILALASRPTYDPNNFSKYPAKNRRNFAINDAYEPGSTMKIVTAAMAMEEGVVNSQSRFYCPGYYKVGVETIRCAQNKAHGSQNFAQIVENSCNVGFVQVGLNIGLERYYRYLKAFGFGQATGIDLPGEAKGILVPQKTAMQIDLATMAMGQANAVTSLQLVQAVAAVANGGKLIKPHVVKEIVDNNGKIIKKFPPQEIRRVISESTAQQLRIILEGEVINGTGTNAYTPGYPVGGKTGTAQKPVPGGYSTTDYVASFVGFAPVEDPKMVCMIVVDSPKGYPYFGGWVAAPVFREITGDVMRYLKVPAAKEEARKEEDKIDIVLVPDLINRSKAEAMSLLNQRGLKAKIDGEGNMVYQQTPRAQSSVSAGSEVIIHLSPFNKNNKEQQITIPDLQGKSLKEVAVILSDLGLHLIPEGYGLASEQKPEAGKVVSAGSSIRVKFQPVGE
ncbi:stage V sporulation protein D [Syntrophomonas palmitatica]|uniref:stage V sporulation protein D n=1 Tax=Syntrophomonas palmitatica TaxID=402877 RepID=UPI0006D02EBE|nr:stage V sporulation protein D [Syntrophomonas palmitatica]